MAALPAPAPYPFQTACTIPHTLSALPPPSWQHCLHQTLPCPHCLHHHGSTAWTSRLPCRHCLHHHGSTACTRPYPVRTASTIMAALPGPALTLSALPPPSWQHCLRQPLPSPHCLHHHGSTACTRPYPVGTASTIMAALPAPDLTLSALPPPSWQHCLHQTLPCRHCLHYHGSTACTRPYPVRTASTIMAALPGPALTLSALPPPSWQHCLRQPLPSPHCLHHHGSAACARPYPVGTVSTIMAALPAPDLTLSALPPPSWQHCLRQTLPCPHCLHHHGSTACARPYPVRTASTIMAALPGPALTLSALPPPSWQHCLRQTLPCPHCLHHHGSTACARPYPVRTASTIMAALPAPDLTLSALPPPSWQHCLRQTLPCPHCLHHHGSTACASSYPVRTASTIMAALPGPALTLSALPPPSWQHCLDQPFALSALPPPSWQHCLDQPFTLSALPPPSWQHCLDQPFALSALPPPSWQHCLDQPLPCPHCLHPHGSTAWTSRLPCPHCLHHHGSTAWTSRLPCPHCLHPHGSTAWTSRLPCPHCLHHHGSTAWTSPLPCPHCLHPHGSTACTRPYPLHTASTMLISTPAPPTVYLSILPAPDIPGLTSTI